MLNEFRKALTILTMAGLLATSNQPFGQEQGSSEPFNKTAWRLAVEDDPHWNWVFPEVFKPQRDFKTEWWYYTGHLKSEKSDWYGYQLTFFRIGMRPAGNLVEVQSHEEESAWRFSELWMGHFAITDINRNDYHFTDRLVRGAMGLAGDQSAANAVKLWLGDWKIENLEATDEARTHRLVASGEGWELDLALEEDGTFLQGEKGLSRKGNGYGQASWYYSHPQMKSSGRLKGPDGIALNVEGRSWFDREIGSNQLAGDQLGWDWIAVQLEKGDALMLYRMRLKNGGYDSTSHGQWMPAGLEDDRNPNMVNIGTSLQFEDFSIVPMKTWKSPKSKAVYPVEWQIRVPSLHLELDLKATVAAQEFHTSKGPGIHYWEGSHSVSGQFQGRPVKGRAYVELTGYAGGVPGLAE